VKRWDLTLLVLFTVLNLVSCTEPEHADQLGAAPSAGKYTTSFRHTESPVSEGAVWLNGATDGVDWGNVATRPGMAYGLQDGNVHYSDATAILKGTWWPNQKAQAKVYVAQVFSGDYPEVELRLRSTLTPHACTGYEVQWSVAPSNPYFAIVRWNGGIGNFFELFHASGSQYAVRNGDVVEASIIGNEIRAYLNGQLLARVTDSTFVNGNPGMGFNYYCGGNCHGPHDGYGFTNFTATGEPVVDPVEGDSEVPTGNEP
jgi:hypothetical protein